MPKKIISLSEGESTREDVDFSVERIDQDFIIKKINTWLSFKSYQSHFKSRLESGLCAGFSTAWLYYQARGKLSHLYSVLNKISLWDERSSACDIYFDEICNILFWFQSPEDISHTIFQTNIQEKINRVASESGKVNKPEFQLSFLFTKDELIEFLKKIISSINEKIVFLASDDHACGIFLDKKKVFLNFMIPTTRTDTLNLIQ
ncbi:MAG: hypothetical protein HY939_01280 [Gammaproteobacteria bacterium]|nr:hypothetical protein [Gammaproteobacteria bacterium]